MVEQARRESYRRALAREAIRKKNQAPELASELYNFLRALQIWRLQGEHRDSAVAGISTPAPYDDSGVLDTREIVDEAHPVTEDIHLLSVERIKDSSVFYMAGAVQGDDERRDEVVEKEGIWINRWKVDGRSEMRKDFKAWKVERRLKKEKKQKEREEKKGMCFFL